MDTGREGKGTNWGGDRQRRTTTKNGKGKSEGGAEVKESVEKEG